MSIHRSILSLSLVVASMALPAMASPPLTSFATRLLTQVHGLRLGKQRTLSESLKQKTGRYLTTKASLSLLDNYLNQPQNKLLYDQVRTTLDANREEFDHLVAIRQLERQCQQLVAQQNQDSATNEELTSQARQLFAQHQHLFDKEVSQRLLSLGEEEFNSHGDELNISGIFVRYDLYSSPMTASLPPLENELGSFSSFTIKRMTWEEFLNTYPLPISNENIPTDGHSATIIGSRDNRDIVSAIKSSEDFYRVSDKIANELIRAVYKNNKDNITTILAENDLSANIVIDDIGTALLQHAASEGRISVVQYLIDNLGADINVENKLHFTTLDAAVFAKQYDTANFLITRGAVSSQPNTKDMIKGAPTLD